jgi:glycerol uptake facilitator-like aquaporin
MEKSQIEKNQEGFVDTKKLIVEFMGVFAFTYVGCWVIVFRDLNNIATPGVAFIHGLTLTVFSWITLDISGAQFNPAITLGLIVTKKIEWSLGVFYMVAQFFGALVGGGFIYIQMTEHMMNTVADKSIIGIALPGSLHYSVSGIWCELLGGFFLSYCYMALVIHQTRHKDYNWYPMVQGFMYMTMNCTIGELSGGAFNPAKALGPAIMAGANGHVQFNQLIGSFIGGILGCVFYSSIYMEEDDEELLNNTSDDNNKDQLRNSEVEKFMMPENESNKSVELK